MFCISKSVLKMGAVTFPSAPSRSGHVAGVTSGLYTVFSVHCKQPYPFLQILSLQHYALAYLLVTVSLVFCTSPILVLPSSSIFAQLLYFSHTK